MVSQEAAKQTPQNPKRPSKQQLISNPVEDGQTEELMFSPRFKSVVAMAGWDEEALLVASLVVEDTPDRESKHNKRCDLHIKSSSPNSRRKRRAGRRSLVSAPVVVLDLDEEETTNQVKVCEEKEILLKEDKKAGGDESSEQSSGVSCSNSVLPCMDKLKEELSCAICLEICYEPSTTPCGHSFCKKCLRSAADKCGKRCPKCRQLISNGRSCTVNTVLWNTIQLLFPQEIEARKKAATSSSRESEHQSPENASLSNAPNQSFRPYRASSRVTPTRRNAARVLRSSEESVRRRRRGIPSQDEDAALALRLQREEFMEVFRGTNERGTSSTSVARANLRAMASRAMNLRARGQPL